MAERQAGVTGSQLVLLSAYASGILLNLGITAVLGRATSSDTLGFFTLVATVFAVARAVFDGGTNSLAAREVARDPARERPLLEGLMAWRRIVGVGIALLVLVLACGEDAADRRTVLLGAAVVLTLQSPTGLYPAFLVRQAQGGPALITTSGLGFTLAGCIVMAACRLAGPLFAGLVVLREFAAARAFAILGRRILGYRPRAGLRGRGLKPFARMALVMFLATLGYTLSFYGDVFLVRWLRGEHELGAYAAAFRPLNPLLMLPGLLLLPVIPCLSAAAVSDRARFISRVRGLTAQMAGIGALGAVAGIALAPDLIGILYGGAYLDGTLRAVDALRWLCAALGVVFATTPFITALLAAGGERALLVVATLGLVVNAAGNLVFLPVFGFTASAVTTAVTAAVIGGGALLALAKTFGSVVFCQPRVGTLVPAAVLGVVLLFLDVPPIPRVLAGALLAAAGLGGLLISPSAQRLRSQLRSDGAA